MPMPEPGTKEYDEVIEFMREDIEGGFALTQIIMAARKAIEAAGKNFDEEFAKWRARRKAEQKAIVWKEVPTNPIVFVNLKKRM